MDNIEIIFNIKNILDKNNKYFSNITNGFIINVNNKDIIVSVHHDLPLIKKNVTVKYQNEVFKTNVIHRPFWNEIITLDIPKEINVKEKIKNFRYNCPNNEIFYISGNKFIKKKNVFIPIAFLYFNPKNIYYEMESLDKEVELSESGKPVLDNNGKIIGILCSKQRNKIFVIPIIYLNKILNKENYTDIFTISNQSKNKINKINRYNVENNLIFYPKLRCEIPIDTYFLLEGDDGKEETIKFKSLEKKRYIVINKELKIKNNDIFEMTNDKYIINIPLLKFLKINNQNLLIKNILNNIINNNKIYIKINNNNFKIVN